MSSHRGHHASTAGTSTAEPPQDWRRAAACRDMPTDLFYVPDGVRGRRKDLIEEQAKQVCAECSVARECRQAAQQHPERWGVWGGLTETERGWTRR